MMIVVAEKLSKGIPHVRVDLYYFNGKIYFGEFIFYDWGGMRPFGNNIDDIELGKRINLPKQCN